MRKFWNEMRLMALLPCFFGAGMLMAQSPAWGIELASGSIHSPANLAEATALPISPAEIVDGKYFRLLQFHGTPDASQRAQIAASGVVLMEYIPRHTYSAAIPADFDLGRLAAMGVRAMHTLAPAQKLRRSLQELPLPAWAVPAPGLLDIELNFPRVLRIDDIRAKALAEGYEILPSTYAGVLSLRIPSHRLLELAGKPWVSFIEPINPPAQPENYTGRTLHRSNMIAAEHPLGRHYDGTGVIVAMGDDGIIGPHIDQQGRVDQSRVTADNGTHGDHVSGTIFGAGNLNPKNKGMAFGATLHVYQVWNAVNDGANANATHGTLFTSTSYSDGCNAGYTSFAQEMDEMTRLTPTLLHVFSAGNEGASDCGYGAGAGWGNVTGGVKIGKNVLTVASLNANGTVDGYSSRGPTEDGRLKPEVAAKGGNVTSTFPNNDYATLSGTSMACPGASGTLAQLAHAYRSLNAGQDPPSALLKALLMNGADDKGNAGPDFKYGFGEMNAYRAVLALENQTYLADTLDQALSDTHQITVPAGTATLKVMLYWHDYEGAVNAAIPLVNDLNLTVVDPNTQSFQPWILNNAPSASLLNALATRGRDSINNAEQVTITAPSPGSYQLIVDGHNIPMGPQGYHLVYEFRDSAVTLTYPNGAEAFVPGETEKIRWDAEGSHGAWTVEYTINNGNTWFLATSGLAGSTRHYDFAVPTGMQSGNVRFRVSRSGVTDESDYNLSIIRVPTNLAVDVACPAYCILDWDSLTTASGYDVFQLGAKYMDSIGTTANSFFQVNGILPNQEYWFAVRARGADSAVGRRTIAIFKPTGIWNCSEPNDVAVASVTGPGAGLIQSCVLDTGMTITVQLQNHSPNAVSNIPVSYRLDGGAAVTETYTGTLNGNSTVAFSFSTQLPLPSIGAHVIEAWCDFAPDNYHGNDTSALQIEYLNGNAVALPYAEDFESFSFCNVSSVCETATCQLSNDWLQGTNSVSDRTDWRTDRGGTPTPLTGPDVDHNPGTSVGRYLYVEASNCFESVAMLHTPCLDLSTMTNPYFSFWFHMLGADMGDLHIDIFANGQWTLDVTPPMIANWGQNWWQRQIDLSAYVGQTVNLRFRGITGIEELSDMAIDDVRLTEGPPVGTLADLESGDLQVYPNPSTGRYIFSLGQPLDQSLRLSIVDMTGRVVIRQNFTNFTKGTFQGSFDLSDQPSGIYFLKIEADGRSYEKKIALSR